MSADMVNPAYLEWHLCQVSLLPFVALIILFVVSAAFLSPHSKSICSTLKLVLGPSQQHFGSWVKKPAILKLERL